MFITQRTQTRSAQQKVTPSRGSKFEPAGREHAQEMAAGKKQHVLSERSNPAQRAVSPRAHLVRRFPARAAIAEQLPIWALSMDLGSAESLIVAIVPFK